MSASEDDIGSQFMEHKVASEDEAAYNQEMARLLGSVAAGAETSSGHRDIATMSNVSH
jgi:hypothetical protein